MIKVQKVTLLVAYEEDEVIAEDIGLPSSWDWTLLCDSVEPIVVIDYETPEKP